MVAAQFFPSAIIKCTLYLENALLHRTEEQFSQFSLQFSQQWTEKAMSNFLTSWSHSMSGETEINYQTTWSKWAWGLYYNIENSIVWDKI